VAQPFPATLTVTNPTAPGDLRVYPAPTARSRRRRPSTMGLADPGQQRRDAARNRGRDRRALRARRGDRGLHPGREWILRTLVVTPIRPHGPGSLQRQSVASTERGPVQKAPILLDNLRAMVRSVRPGFIGIRDRAMLPSERAGIPGGLRSSSRRRRAGGDAPSFEDGAGEGRPHPVRLPSTDAEDAE
jgi:hypothetical protein